MKKNISICDHCGHEERIYTHSLNQQIVGALRQLVDFFELKRTVCNLQKDLNLTKNQYNNFQKLRHFNLVEKTLGGWIPTTVGRHFVRDEVSIYTDAASLNNTTLPPDHEVFEDKQRTRKYAFEIDNIRYKQKDDYSDTLFDFSP